MKRRSLQRRRAGIVAASSCAVLVALPLAAQDTGMATVDAQFGRAFAHQYDRLQGVQPDMLVEELRLRVELVASRGSQVGAASNEKRVRGFEALLLKNLQDTHCRANNMPTGRPSPALLNSVTLAADGQRLLTETTDRAELSAIAQRLIDALSPARMCALTSLDEVR